MRVIRRCPNCNSSKISGSVSTEDGRYIQKIYCEKCSYSNRRDIGSAERNDF